MYFKMAIHLMNPSIKYHFENILVYFSTEMSCFLSTRLLQGATLNYHLSQCFYTQIPDSSLVGLSPETASSHIIVFRDAPRIFFLRKLNMIVDKYVTETPCLVRAYCVSEISLAEAPCGPCTGWCAWFCTSLMCEKAPSLSLKWRQRLSHFCS